VDTIPVKSMRKRYLKFFEDIPEKKYLGEMDRFIKEELTLIDNNLIVFKSISEYYFLNIYLIFSYKSHNQMDFQLLNFISYLIGSEYTKGFCYYLKENDIAKFIKTSVDYYYDSSAIINVGITLIENSTRNVDKICVHLNSLLNKLSKIKTPKFIKLYENFRKIHLLQSIYHDKTEASDVSNSVIENLINGDKNLCIMRKNFVPEYDPEIYGRYIQLLEDIQIKITTNLNIEKRQDSKFLKSKHYKTQYYLSNYECKSPDVKIDYEIKNLCMFSDITIKFDVPSSTVDKNELPKLIFKSDVREIYLVEHNKYEQPIINISIIRKNPAFINKNNSLILTIYNNLCLRTLNYYLDTMSDYKMYFSMNITDEHLVLNFNGLDYVMNKFINDIVYAISFYSIEINPLSNKYFEEIKRDLKESLINLKFNSPYALCLKYFSIILSNDFMPEEAIGYIDSLTFDSFLKQLDKLLLFEKEYFIIVGNLKKCPEEFFCEDSVVKNAMNYVDIMTLNSLRYKTYSTELTLSHDKTSKTPDFELQIANIFQNFNYTLDKTQINPKEVNNCLIDCYLTQKYELEFKGENIDIEQLKIIFRDKLIYGLISDLLNEPFFDKIRTVDKLGYIVKTTTKYHTCLNKAVLFLCYIVQSNYAIEDIYKSIDKFNIGFYKDYQKNKEKFKKMFDTLKKSKKLDLNKNPTDLNEEMTFYLSTVINRYGIFNYNKLNSEILESITFSELDKYIRDFFDLIVKTNRHHVILDKNIHTT
jgi:insulysin